MKATPITGVVTARPCACCGHHEIGILTSTGDYIALKPGMRASIIEGDIEPVDDEKR